MNNFKVEDFTLVCQFIACRGFDEFAKMYEDIGFISEWYAKEKYNIACGNFVNWWCSLDIENQIKIINYIKNFYHC